jgi:hypothetical protein
MVRDSRPVGVVASFLAEGREGRGEFRGLIGGSRSHLATTDLCANATVAALAEYKCSFREKKNPPRTVAALVATSPNACGTSISNTFPSQTSGT